MEKSKNYNMLNYGFTDNGPTKIINQDAYFLYNISEKLCIIGVADGVSNAKYGGQGSQTTTENLSKYIRRNTDIILKQLNENHHNELLKNFFELSRKNLEEKSTKKGIPIDNYATTLSISIIDLDKNKIISGIIGDSPIWIVSRDKDSSKLSAKKFIKSEDHTFSNVVRPLTDKNAIENIRISEINLVNDYYVLIMMSDGVESLLDKEEKYEPILKEFGIIDEKSKFCIPEKLSHIQQKLIEFFSVLHRKENDDKTMLISLIFNEKIDNSSTINKIQQDLNHIKDYSEKHISYLYEYFDKQTEYLNSIVKQNEKMSIEINNQNNQLNEFQKNVKKFNDDVNHLIEKIEDNINNAFDKLKKDNNSLYDVIRNQERDISYIEKDIKSLKEDIRKLDRKSFFDILRGKKSLKIKD